MEVKWEYESLEKTFDINAERNSENRLAIHDKRGSVVFIDINDTPNLIKELEDKHKAYKKELQFRENNKYLHDDNKVKEILTSLFEKYNKKVYEDFKDAYHYAETEDALKELFATHGIQNVEFTLETIDSNSCSCSFYQEDLISFPKYDLKIVVITESYEQRTCGELDTYYRYAFENPQK